jgi:hypothetical protein
MGIPIEEEYVDLPPSLGTSDNKSIPSFPSMEGILGQFLAIYTGISAASTLSYIIPAFKLHTRPLTGR